MKTTSLSPSLYLKVTKPQAHVCLWQVIGVVVVVVVGLIVLHLKMD